MRKNHRRLASNTFCGRAIVGFVVLPFVLAFASAAFAQSSPGPSLPLITQPINEANPIVLAGNTRAEAQNPVNDRGIVSDSLPLPHMMLQLRRPAAQGQALDALIDQLQNQKSPDYHHWRSPSDLGAQYGPAVSDIQTLSGWLQQHGFTVNTVYPNGMVIDFSGTAGQIRTTFRTAIHNLSIKGVAHIANMTDPQIPAALAPAVAGIVALHDFRPKHAYSGGNNCSEVSPPEVTAACYQVTPADLATIYNFNAVFNAGTTGQGQKIYLIEDSNIDHESDWETFRSLFGLKGYTDGTLSTIHPVPPSGSNNCANPETNGDAGETTLDAEWSSAAAPSAAIILATCANTNTTSGIIVAIENLLNAEFPPAIISMSYEICEAAMGASANEALSSVYQTGAAAGTSIFVAAGDQGAALCDYDATFATHGVAVNALASTPYNVAVGGTDFADTYLGENGTYWNSKNTSAYGSAKSYIPEIPWNDTCASQLIATFEGFAGAYGSSGFCNSSTGEGLLEPWAGSGGPSGCATGAPSVPLVVSGTCAGYPKPSWQSGVLGIPQDGVRDVPDVSLFAAQGPWGHMYAFCYTGGGGSCTNAGGAPAQWGFGTSAASPIMAGIQALIDQTTGAMEGNPNNRYYELAAKEYASAGSSICNSSRGNAISGLCIFHNVTLGDNDVACQSLEGTAFGATFYNCYVPSGSNGVLSTSNGSYLPAYKATTGWDFATGIGTVNVANLVKYWTEPTMAFRRQTLTTSMATARATSPGATRAVISRSG
jgi:subtilase family serine protease